PRAGRRAAGVQGGSRPAGDRRGGGTAARGGGAVGMDAIRQIVNAVLYEGYILWPYRRSALKNQRRWGFGGVYPRGVDGELSLMRVECLLEAGAGASVQATVRFLQVVERELERADGERVSELTVGG